MTDHLPECLMLDERYPKHPLENCDYCNMLRACEQRVRLEYRVGLADYAAGLDAAREAVANQCGHTKSVSSTYQCDHDRALAAIDALRGEV